jgi:predicted nucleotidyltransferase
MIRKRLDACGAVRDAVPVENVLLEGVVGSTAYGLAHAGSDVDRLGVYAVPASAFHGLDLPIDRAASVVEHEPDRTLHEARKYCQLALSCNPTATELMWLPDDLYDVRTELGDGLIAIRSAFLSASRVRDAFLGYASQQLARLASKDVRAQSDAKIAKHARHLARLAHQGRELYETGVLRVRLDDPQWYVDFGLRVVADVTIARDLVATTEIGFAEARSPLPEEPDRDAVESWLRHVRACIP